MSCIFRVYGENVDIQKLLLEIPLVPNKVWKKGEQRILKNKYYVDSGASFIASDADLDEFDSQVNDCMGFLEINRAEIAKAISFPGVENAELDFGVALNEGYVAHYSFFPAKFLQEVARAGIGIGISHYACSSDDQNS